MIPDIEALLSSVSVVVTLINQVKAGNTANLPAELVNLATLAKTDLAPAEAVIAFLDDELAKGDSGLIVAIKLFLAINPASVAANNAADVEEGVQQALNAGGN